MGQGPQPRASHPSSRIWAGDKVALEQSIAGGQGKGGPQGGRAGGPSSPGSGLDTALPDCAMLRHSCFTTSKMDLQKTLFMYHRERKRKRKRMGVGEVKLDRPTGHPRRSQWEIQSGLLPSSSSGQEWSPESCRHPNLPKGKGDTGGKRGTRWGAPGSGSASLGLDPGSRLPRSPNLLGPISYPQSCENCQAPFRWAPATASGVGRTHCSGGATLEIQS